LTKDEIFFSGKMAEPLRIFRYHIFLLLVLPKASFAPPSCSIDPEGKKICSKHLRIALCVAGQARTIVEPLIRESQAKFLLDPLRREAELDVFVVLDPDDPREAVAFAEDLYATPVAGQLLRAGR
jgi:hypothetical protein